MIQIINFSFTLVSSKYFEIILTVPNLFKWVFFDKTCLDFCVISILTLLELQTVTVFILFYTVFYGFRHLNKKW